MAITIDDIKDQILLEVGDVDPLTGDTPATPEQGLIFQNLDLLWANYVAKDQVAPGLRALYTKRAALRLVLANLAQKRFDVSDVLAGLTMKANAIWQHFWDLHECCKGEIAAVEKASGVNTTTRGGRLTTRSPIAAAYRPDPNYLRYGGAPRGGRGFTW